MFYATGPFPLATVSLRYACKTGYRVEPPVLIRTAETLKIKRAHGAFNF
jgi:hypothetical protein